MESTIYRKVSLACAFGILVWLGMLNAPSLTELPLQSPDSVDYLSGYGRPWLIVTWWNTLGVSVAAVWASYLLSLFCWARLGWVTGGVIGVYLAILCSSGEIIYSWHFRVLSEGVAWSGIALLAAETTVMARRPSRRHVWQWIIAIALNTVRVTSGLTALATIPVIWKAGGGRYWWAIVLAILLCLSPSIQQAPTTYTDCQVDSIILGRVAMDNPKMLKQFRAAGMPWPIDQQWIGQPFPEREEIRKTDPEFVSWLETHGKAAIIINALSYPEQTFQVAFHAMATERLEILLPWRGNQFATMIQRAILEHIGVITIMVTSCILGCWWVALVLLTAVVTAAGGAGWEVGRHIVHVAIWELAALFVCMEQVRWRGLALLRKVRERAAQKVMMKEDVARHDAETAAERSTAGLQPPQ